MSYFENKLHFFQKQLVILFKEFCRHNEYAIGDEKRRENINRIMKMSQEHAEAKNKGEGNEHKAQSFMIPVKQGKEKWHTCVSGEKEIIPGSQFA